MNDELVARLLELINEAVENGGISKTELEVGGVAYDGSPTTYKLDLIVSLK